MKKVILKSAMGIPLKPPTVAYQQRKNMEHAYKDIFEALLRLPDKAVQKRVMDAINNKPCPECCKRTHGAVRKETATQTETNMLNCKIEPKSPQSTTDSNCSTVAVVTEVVVGDSSNGEVRRKRRRKIGVPQVIKTSHAKQMQQLPKLKQRKLSNSVDQNSKKNDINVDFQLRDRSDSIFSNTLSIDDMQWEDITNIAAGFDMKQEDFVIHTMYEEYCQSNRLENGLSAIHQAIINNNVPKFQRQLFVWTHIHKRDISMLLTDEDEDCLQLAICNKSDAQIIKGLIDVDANISLSIDKHSNTLIHLGILYEIDLKSFELMLNKIDIELLLQHNDQGYTALHEAVRANQYQHAQLMIQTIELKTMRADLCKDGYILLPATKEDFCTHYAKLCDNLQSRLAHRGCKKSLKQKFIDAVDLRSGNSALFLAIENRCEHLIMFLLSHFANPRIENHAGQNAKAYYCEFSKSFSFGVEAALDNVINVVS